MRRLAIYIATAAARRVAFSLIFIVSLYGLACIAGSKIRLVTLDAAIDLLKGMVVGCKDGKSYLADTHFAQLEGIKEESTLLLRNFYKATI